jgi:hypothetical protein
VLNNMGPLRYFRNDTPSVGSWLAVDLSPGSHPYVAPHGHGARVVAKVGGKEIARVVTSDPSYLATSPHTLHFGLGHAKVIDELRVDWPRGMTTVLFDIPANQKLTIFAPALGDLDANGVIDGVDTSLLTSLYGPVNGASNLHADLDNSGIVDAVDLAILEAAAPE